MKFDHDVPFANENHGSGILLTGTREITQEHYVPRLLPADVRRVLLSGEITVGELGDSYPFGCLRWANIMVSPHERRSNDPQFRDALTNYLETNTVTMGLIARIQADWATCMSRSGHAGFTEISDYHANLFDLSVQVGQGQTDPAEAFAYDVELSTASLECTLWMNTQERYRQVYEQATAPIALEIEDD